MRSLELLIPAGNLENLKVAIDYGADAVYIGGEFFSLRAKAKNFSKEDMKAGIDYAHKRGKKVYVTANILGHNEDLEAARGIGSRYIYHSKGSMAGGGDSYFHTGK